MKELSSSAKVTRHVRLLRVLDCGCRTEQQYDNLADWLENDWWELTDDEQQQVETAVVPKLVGWVDVPPMSGMPPKLWMGT